MTPPLLHVIGVDPGGTTGWARISVSRASIFGREPGGIERWDYGAFTGDEDIQVTSLCRLIRETQNLDYLVGPAVVVEDFDVDKISTTDAEVLFSPIRIAAKLAYAAYLQKTGDATITMQSRTLAKSAATDDRLRAWGLYDRHSGDHARDATRHAITALRRASARAEIRETLWASPLVRT